MVWSQMLQLRTPLEHLFAADPVLAERLKQVANDLHNAGLQAPLSTTPLNDEATLESTAQTHRRLAEQYERLVDQVRSIPGFKDFLHPKRVSELVRVAQTGPVVVINVHNSRCDALVLLPGKSEITHVPLPNFSYDKATKARAQMEQSLEYQNIRERSSVRRPLQAVNHTREDHLESVLTALWADVVKPILDTLGYTVSPSIVRPYCIVSKWNHAADVSGG
jgi:hypothetical protein